MYAYRNNHGGAWGIEGAYEVENFAKIGWILADFEEKASLWWTSMCTLCGDQLKCFMAICKRPEFFPAKLAWTAKMSNLPKSRNKVGVLIRIVLNLVSTAFNIVSSTVGRLHFEFCETIIWTRRCYISCYGEFRSQKQGILILFALGID